MGSAYRSILIAIALLLAFLAVALPVQLWMNRETGRVRAEAERTLRDAASAAVSLLPPAPAQWEEPALRRLGATLGGRAELLRPGDPPPAVEASSLRLVVEVALPTGPGWRVRVTTEPPALARLQHLQNRGLAAITILALALAVIPVLLALLTRRPGASPDDAHTRHRYEAAGLEQFARLSVERGAQLEQEHGARRRAEENLLVNRNLLDHSLAERVRLGRELHDNICQTLYAVSLTLESVQRNMNAPPNISQRLDQCMGELRRLNQEVRAYIRQLEPEQLRREPLTNALDRLVAGLGAPDGPEINARLAPEVLARIPAQATEDVVNIVREAVSNSIKHGHARHIQVRAENGENTVALVVADDGQGFEPAAPGAGAGGHGLANMRARAAALGGDLSVQSSPGKGTRVLLNLPAA